MGNELSLKQTPEEQRLEEQRKVETLMFHVSFHGKMLRHCIICGNKLFTDAEVTTLQNGTLTFRDILETFERNHDGKTGYKVSMEDNNVVFLEFCVSTCESYDCMMRVYKISGRVKYRYYGKLDWTLSRASPVTIS